MRRLIIGRTAPSSAKAGPIHFIVAMSGQMSNLFGQITLQERLLGMAKLMSKKTRETVQTIAVIAVVLALLFFYVVYPLISLPGQVGRPDRDKFKNSQYRLPNDPTYFTSAGMKPDTLTVESNDNISLNLLHFMPDSSANRVRGTVILLAPDDTDRTALRDYVAPFLDSGLAVVLYDQRATGVSGGTYHMGGVLEADDLSEVVAYLSLHGRLHPPLSVVGFGSGADAAINAARSEKRISYLLAIDPSLTTTRYIDRVVKKGDLIPIPFSKATYFWWYQKITSFPYDRNNTKDIASLETPALILVKDADLTSPELTKLQQVSPPGIVQTAPLLSDLESLKNLILNKICSIQSAP